MPGLEGTKPEKRIAIGGLALFFCLFAASACAANSPPATGTIYPASATANVNQTRTFSATYSDPDGWANIQAAYLLINTVTNGANCFYGYYNQNTNRLYLRNDNSTLWMGGCIPGTNTTISNSYTALNCYRTSISNTTATLSINWNITFKPAFAGVKNTYLYVSDDYGNSTGWNKAGDFCIFREPVSP
jgi:hypothetical protein